MAVSNQSWLTEAQAETAEAEELRRRQIDILHERTPASSLAAIATALVAAAVMVQVTSPLIVALWAFTILAMSLYRLYRWMRNARLPAPSSVSSRAPYRIAVFATLRGLVWGIGVSLLYPDGQADHQIFLALIIAGMAAGGAMLLAPVPAAALASVMTMILPVGIRIAMEGDGMHMAVAAVTMAFAFALAATIRSGYRTFADSVLASMKNRDLANRIGARNRVLQRLADGASLPETLNEVVVSTEQIRSGMMSSILILDKKEGVLRHGAAPSLPKFYVDAIDGIEPGPNVGSCGAAVSLGERVIVEDIRDHPNWTEFLSLTERAGLRACWSEPIKSSSGETLGACAIYLREPGLPNDSDIELMEMEARLAAIAIERKQLEERLRQSQRLEAVGQLTGGIAHDFNNLLAVVIGNLELLNEHITDAPLRKFAGTALKAATRGAAQTHGLLAFSRQQVLRPQLTNVDDLIVGMQDLLEQTMGESIELRFDRTTDAWLTRIDPGQLETALINLAANARDAISDGGILTIKIENLSADSDSTTRDESGVAGDAILITIRDNGSGIAQQHLTQVFEPFFTTKEVGAGSGLGLSMVYGFVKQSGGQVQINSEVGHFTAVSILLPRAEEGLEETRMSVRSSEEPCGQGETVLIVEDEEDVRRLAADILGALGYKTLEAANAQDAMTMLYGSCEIDLLFTDMVLPGELNGFDLASSARSKRPDLKVLYTSGYSPDSLPENGPEGDVGRLLMKPYAKAKLARYVHDSLVST